MLFRELLNAFRSRETLDECFAEFDEMLAHAEWMFDRANEALKDRNRIGEVADPLYERDRSINRLLRSIRGHIIRHLQINPGSDVPASLALISVARDAERIGDYCKNVFEVARFYRQPFHVARYHEPLEEIRAGVKILFGEVREAFRKTDAKAGEAAIEKCRDLRKRCDSIIEQLLRDETNMETHEAVAYSLLARHYKRVAAHLSNICTALLGRVEDMDFHRKTKRHESE